ncbi:DUF6924 domain-containing protein [Streptomyces sp. NPDC048018]|uniref:DUF6924 domain-containing protein n=1 Tax=Streptomyces sp. NPDC048018 TaxID=3365499 RepID=UPI0037202FA9
MALPQPEDLTSLVLRTDFADESAWDALCAAFDALDDHRHATCVSDRRFAGAEGAGLAEEDGAAEEDERVFHVFLADAAALADPSYPLLAVDLEDEPGRTFRVPLRWFADVSANLSLANMDFAEFADVADDEGGTFRGYGDA